jgi:GMP synthase (glutamine-hydrolysing)
VRQVGGLLGLQAEITQRQPFPGPGLAVRLIADDGGGTVSQAQVEAVAALARETDPELGATVVPVRTVGVQGDQRSYRKLALVDHGRAGITLGEVDWDLLMGLGNRLANRLDFVNRTGFVLAATGGEGAATLAGLSVTPTHVTPETAELLRELDSIVTAHLTLPTLGQSFAVLLPVGRDGKRSVAVRTFVTEDYMTGRPGRPGTDFPVGVLERVASAIVTGFGDRIDLVVYDVTSKPPATVEWE